MELKTFFFEKYQKSQKIKIPNCKFQILTTQLSTLNDAYHNDVSPKQSVHPFR